MIRRPPRSNRPDTLFPYTTLFRSVTFFAATAIGRGLTPPYYPSRLAEQLAQIGWFSLPVVWLTAIFTGAALAQQIYTGGSRFNAESTVPAIEIGRAHACTPVTNAQLVCRLLLAKKNSQYNR